MPRRKYARSEFLPFISGKGNYAICRAIAENYEQNNEENNYLHVQGIIRSAEEEGGSISRMTVCKGLEGFAEKGFIKRGGKVGLANVYNVPKEIAKEIHDIYRASQNIDLIAKEEEPATHEGRRSVAKPRSGKRTSRPS